MKKTLTLIGMLAVLSMAAVGGQMYEWRDPTTGRLMLGDKPPSGVKYWEEGKRSPGELSPEPAKPKVPPSVREATELEVEKCLDFLKSKYSFKDENSLRVEGARITVVHENGNKIININVNGKNSYGAYAGAKPVICQYLNNGDKEIFYEN